MDNKDLLGLNGLFFIVMDYTSGFVSQHVFGWLTCCDRMSSGICEKASTLLTAPGQDDANSG